MKKRFIYILLFAIFLLPSVVSAGEWLDNNDPRVGYDYWCDYQVYATSSSSEKYWGFDITILLDKSNSIATIASSQGEDPDFYLKDEIDEFLADATATGYDYSVPINIYECYNDSGCTTTKKAIKIPVTTMPQNIYSNSQNNGKFSCPNIYTVYTEGKTLEFHIGNASDYTGATTDVHVNQAKYVRDKDTINDTSSDDESSKPNLGEEVEGCEVVPDVIRKWIKVALNFVKYVALILVVVLGTLDFIKAAGSGEPDGMKKAGQAFLKRIIAVIILFLLPMLIELILNLINLYGSTGDCFGVLE